MYDSKENNIKLEWNFNFELPVVTKCQSDKLILDMQQTQGTLIRLLPRSSLIWVHIVFNKGYIPKMISRPEEQTTKVVTGQLRVKINFSCTLEKDI